MDISVNLHECKRCGHKWIQRLSNLAKKPPQCAKCRSELWDKDYVRNIKPEHRAASSESRQKTSKKSKN